MWHDNQSYCKDIIRTAGEKADGYESEGKMPDRLIQDFVEEVTAHKLKVDSIIISKGNRTEKHFFRENAKRDGRSLSKVVSGLAMGIAVEKGLVQPENPIMDYFQDIEIASEQNKDHLGKAKIKHLLSMSLGHDMPLMMAGDYKKLPEDTDYISYILNSSINYPPGTFFVYTNACTYLLSAIMQKITGITFNRWVQENLLTPLGIEELHWDHSRQGICMGATGLHLDVEDAHKIGLLLLNRGRYRSSTSFDSNSAESQPDPEEASGYKSGGASSPRQIVPAQWIDTMRLMHTPNQDWEKFHNPANTCLKKVAYGYHIWVCGDGSQDYPNTHFFGDGANGQQLIICPEEEKVIAIMARVQDSGKLVKIICKTLLNK